MKYAVVSLHNASHAKLGNMTWPNKEEYCKRHDYAGICQTDGFGDNIYYAKLDLMISVLHQIPTIEWAWWLDADAIITNMTKKIEDVIDNDYHIIMATDFNALNCGSFLVRNTPEGRGWLMDIAALRNKFEYRLPRCLWPEQQPMIDRFIKYRDIFKVVPQRTLNSTLSHHNDLLNTPARWEKGDWVLHTPGMQMDERYPLFTNVLQKDIVR